MPAKEWLVPLGLAALTFGGLSLLPPLGGDGDGVQGGTLPSTYIDPFPGHVRLAEGNATVLVLDRERAHTVGRFAFTDWQTPHVGLGTTSPTYAGCGCVGPMWHVLVPAGEPRFGLGGHNATRVTVHVFDGDGELVASNGNASEKSRLTGKFAPNDLPGGVWYLGANATAPDGTRHLPLAARALLPQLRALLVGLPEGGVATTHTDALSGSYGRLYITARIDALVHAP